MADRTFSAKERAHRRGRVDSESSRIERETREEIEARVGPRVNWRQNSKGDVVGISSVNAHYFAELYATKRHLVWDIEEQRFYAYSPHRGIWEILAPEKNLNELGEFMVEQARAEESDQLIAKNCLKLHRDIQTHLKGCVQERNPFTKDPYEEERHIVFKNGVFTIRNGTLEGFRTDFRPEDRARNLIPVDYDENARCRRVIDDLLRPALPPETADEDISLLFRFLGLFLLGFNVPQRMLVLDGAAGSGKTTFSRLAGLLVGNENVGSLRTAHLGDKFENAGYLGKTMLCAPDVDQKFLLQKNAGALKSLVGGDLLEAELKGARDRVSFQGTFNVILTSNSPLRVKLEHDVDAWRRRLAVVSFCEHQPPKKVPGFEKQLFQMEGSGIVNRALQGLEEFFEAGSSLELSDGQLQRIEEMLERSDMVGEFLRDHVELREHGQLAKKRIRERFMEYCRGRRWSVPSDREVNAAIKTGMEEIFSATESNSISDPDACVGNVIGYRGIDWVND